MRIRPIHSLLLLMTCIAATVEARDWVDASGHYHFKGDLVASNDTMIILEKGNKDLVAVDIDQLSKEDQKYLDELAEKADTNPDMQTWTTRQGLKIRAAALEYVRRDVTIRRRRGKPYINDKRFDNLPGIYRKIVPGIVAHFEGIEMDEKGFPKWVRSLGSSSKKYTCEGVLLELENGDLYAVPFFFFSDADLEVLRPGWEQWVAAQDSERDKEHYSMSMRARANAERQKEAEQRQVAKLQLQLQGYQAGLFDLWEVAIFPGNGFGMPMRVVVPARNSQQARVAAVMQYPGYRAGAAGKVSRKF